MAIKLCKECNKQFNSTPKNRNYCSEECFKEHRKKYERKLQKSPAIRAAIKKYRESEKGKAAIKRYRESEKGKTTVKAIAKRFYGKNSNNASYKAIFRESHKKWKKKEVTKERLNQWFLKNSDQKEEINNLISKGEKITNYLLRLKERKGDKNKTYNQKYFSTDKGKKKRVENMTSFYKANPHARFILAVRKRISGFMEIKKMTKRNKTFHMIGCTPQQLIAHIEKQFQPGMTWENWGVHGWHIDHRIPLDSGKTLEEVEKLCHYTNLQPMWAEENRKKSNKILPTDL